MNNSLDAVCYSQRAEVYQETDFFLRYLQIGEELRFMDRMQTFNGLQFENYLIFYEQIQSISAIQIDPAIDNGQWFLGVDLKVPLLELIFKTSFVS